MSAPSLRTQRLLVGGGLLVAAAGVGIGLAVTTSWLGGGEAVGARFGVEVTATAVPETTEATPDTPATATTAAPTATPTATNTPKPTVTPTPSPTRTPSPTPTPTPTPTATPSPPPPGPVLAVNSFSLPADGTPNGGGAIGPFSGSGRTVTLVETTGAVAGYAYWFRWNGQAYDAPRGGASDRMYPDVSLLVADANGEQAAVAFSASELTSGLARAAEAGRFRFTVTITSATLTSFGGGTYVWGSDLTATLAVAYR